MIILLSLVLSVVLFPVFLAGLLLLGASLPDSVCDVGRVLLHGIDDSDDILLNNKKK